MARENRKAVQLFVIKTGKKISVYVVFTYTVWSVNLGFGKSIQSYSSFSNEPKTAIVRGVESPSLVSRGGDLGKSDPGPRAKADARRHAKTGSRSIFVNGFVPQNTYCQYHKNAPLSCKTTVKLSDNQFQPKDDGSDMYDQNGTSKFDPRDYKGGPPPFEKFDYDNPNHTRKNVDFSNERRMNHSYDGHAEKCFGMTENRNKASRQRFQDKIENYIQSPDTIKIDGSYRYETPTYHYKKPDEDLIVTVNATNNEYISVRNATDFQLEKLEIDGNLGYDSRPSMSLTLKLRGPKQ